MKECVFFGKPLFVLRTVYLAMLKGVVSLDLSLASLALS